MSTSGSNSTLFAPRLPMIIPQVSDPALQTLLKMFVTEMNKIPPTSQFSFTTPNSNISAMPGTWGHNINSAASVYWMKQTGSGNTGWIPLA